MLQKNCKMHDRFCQLINLRKAQGRSQFVHKLKTVFIFSQDFVGEANVKNAWMLQDFGLIWLLTTNNLYIFVLELQIDPFWLLSSDQRLIWIGRFR